MGKYSTNTANLPNNSPAPFTWSNNGFPSVLDNKETFLHFSAPKEGGKSQKNDFILASNRHFNLNLGNKLIEAGGEEFRRTQQVIANLLSCKKNVVVEIGKDNSARLHTTTDKCNSQHCAICNRIKSAKITNRVVKTLEDEENEELFDFKHFYFVTFTLKHNEETRNEIYLKELKDHLTKFYRSKIFTNNFLMTGAAKNAGLLSHFECTFTKNGFHIHNHALLVGDRLKMPIAEYEKELQKIWLKITGDSTGLRFDLVKVKDSLVEDKTMTYREKVIRSAVPEIIKYSTKAGAIAKMTDDDVSRYIDWIEYTKGLNFLNARGILRGLGITGAKSKYDEKAPEKEFKEDAKYIVTSTAKAKFNYDHRKSYIGDDKKKVFEDVFIKQIVGISYDITNLMHEVKSLLHMPLDDDLNRPAVRTNEYIIQRFLEEVGTIAPSTDDFPQEPKNLPEQLELDIYYSSNMKREDVTSWKSDYF